MDPQWANVVINAVLVALVFWYAHETKQIRRAEQVANQPFLGCQFELKTEETMEVALTIRQRPVVFLRNFGRGLATNVEIRVLGNGNRHTVRTRTAISPAPHGITTILDDWHQEDLHGCTLRITCRDQGGRPHTFWQRGDRNFHGCFEHTGAPADTTQRAIQALTS